MNKTKLLYDVITTMKEKEVIKGTFKAEGKKGDEKIVHIHNEFEKNLSSGLTKAKVNFELDRDGRKTRHESSSEFYGDGCHGFMGHGLMRHAHFQRMHGQLHSEFEKGREIKGRSIKDRLSRLANVLSILNSVKAEELEDGGALLKLKLCDIPEETRLVLKEKLKNSHARVPQEQAELLKARLNHIPPEMREALMEKMKDGHTQRLHEHFGFMKEFSTVENPDFELSLKVSKDKELEKLSIIAAGIQKNEDGKEQAVSFQAELSLIS